jgi:tellurite resistance protein TehA-like permease
MNLHAITESWPRVANLRIPRAAMAGGLLATGGLGLALGDHASQPVFALVSKLLLGVACYAGLVLTLLLVTRWWRDGRPPVQAADHIAGSAFVMSGLSYVNLLSQVAQPADSPSRAATWALTCTWHLVLMGCMVAAWRAARRQGRPVITPSIAMPSTVLFLAAALAPSAALRTLLWPMFALASVVWLLALATLGHWRLADRHLPHALILASPPSLAAVAVLAAGGQPAWVSTTLALLGTFFWVNALVCMLWRTHRVALNAACWALVFPTAAQAHALQLVGDALNCEPMQHVARAQLAFAGVAWVGLMLAFARRGMRPDPIQSATEASSTLI